MVSKLISHARRPVGRGLRRWTGVGALSALACGGASAAYVQTSLDLRPTDAALSFHAASALTPVSFASALASYGQQQSVADATGMASGSVLYTAGGIHAAAFSRASGTVLQQGPVVGAGDAQVSAAYLDAFVVHSADAPDGTPAMLYADPIHVDANSGGVVAASPGSTVTTYHASWTVTADLVALDAQGHIIPTYTQTHWTHSETTDSISDGQPNVTTVYGQPGHDAYLAVRIILGEPISLSLRMSLSSAVQAAPNEQANSFVDLSHSFTWGGISQITDANGVPLSHYTALSATGGGFDYVNAATPLSAVPEPASGLLMLLGAGAWALLRRPWGRRMG